MALTREKKNQIIAEVKENLEKQKGMIFIDFSGLDSEDVFKLRKTLKEAGCKFKVVKKSLLQIALKKTKTPISEKIKDIPGQLALIFDFKEENVSPKITYNFSKDNKELEILGGYLDNEVKESDQVITIAKLPSKKELLSNLANVLSSPRSNFVHVLKGNLQRLTRVLIAINK